MNADAGEREGIPRDGPKRSGGHWRVLLAAGLLYSLAWVVVNVYLVAGLQCEAVTVQGPGGRPCLGTVWTMTEPKAVLLLGHGVTANRGVLALAANAFARNGYAAVAIDFWGHGRSRERFDWMSNHEQVNAWCDWARSRFPGLPLAYLGHSMGGEAGDRAFRDAPKVDAFVSMGMLPQSLPACKTLLAFGRFEELFSEAQARKRADGKADILVSPYSDHTGEAADPVLIRGITEWLNGALGIDAGAAFPWLRWGLLLLAAAAGSLSALAVSQRVVVLLRFPGKPAPSTPLEPPGRLNLFRPAAWLLRCSGEASPPRSGRLLTAVTRGVVFSLVLVTLLSWLFTVSVYTCSLLHPERCAAWLVLSTVMAGLFSVTVRALERLPLKTALQRFAVGALTRAVPLLVLCLVLQLMGPGIAFLGMMFGILAFVFVFVAAVHALATRAAGDYRSGAVACGITLAWLTAFWFPLVWG
ncbi:MAG: alpha/beta fold hydrolase [Candidatus Hydrogenedentes bacterium]|nr:alpha/beta fold hydrolase [Candidatus Hydrogenedentota bacterium]